MERSLMKAVLYGWISIIILLLFSTFVLALIVRFTTISELTISYISLIIALLTLFISGLIAGVKGKANGWFVGLLTGGGFTLLTFLVQFLGYNQLFSLKQFAFHIAYIMAAIIGSIVGVNFVHVNE